MNKKGSFSIIFGILLIAAALSLTAYNFWDSNRAGMASQELVQALPIPETVVPVNPSLHLAMIGATDIPEMPAEVPKLDTEVPEMVVAPLSGQPCIGVLDVPEYRLSLPIIEIYSLDNLQAAPCVYYGSYFTNDLVICGHNYTTHFGKLRDIPLGSDIYLTTVDGCVYHYVVDNLETLSAYSVTEMTQGDWDLILFTCTTDGQSRRAIRCILD